MGYTLEQLKTMGAQPFEVDTPSQNYGSQGYTIEQLQSQGAQPLSMGENIADRAKTIGKKVLKGAGAVAGGVATGIAGGVLTAEDYLGRKIVNTFGGEQARSNLAAAPSLNEQFKSQTYGNQSPRLYGAGQFVGEVGALAAPVAKVGSLVKAGAKAAKVGNLGSKVIQGAAEGAAFTLGQSLQRNEKQSLSDFAINSGLSAGFPLAGAGAQKLAQYTAPRIINSLIKPLAKNFAYGKNPGKTITELGITGHTFEDFIDNIAHVRNSVGERIGSVVAKSEAPVDLSNVLSPIDEALAKANKMPKNNSPLITRLENLKEDLSPYVTPISNGQDAQKFKELIGSATKWTGQASDDGLVNGALKKVYSAVRDNMDSTFSRELSPAEFKQYKKLTNDYGNLVNAEQAAVYRDKILERQDLITFGAKNAGILSGIATGIMTGDPITGVLTALAGVSIDKAMASTAFKTRLASYLVKLSPREVSTFVEMLPGAKSLYSKEELNTIVSKAKQAGRKLNVKLKSGYDGKNTPISMAPKDTQNTINNAVKNDIPTNILQSTTKVNSSTSTPKKKQGSLPGFIGEKPTTPKNGLWGKSLEKEALKYKSAEEFVNSRDIVYHGSTRSNIDNIENNGFKSASKTYFAKDEGAAHIFGGGETPGNSTGTIAVDVTDAKPFIDEKGNTVVSSENLKNIKTKSQLTDIWNKAHGKTPLKSAKLK